MVLTDIDKDWNYYWLSKNSNITWDIVQNNPQIQWGYDYLSRNQFNKDSHLIKKRLMQKYFDIWLIKSRAIRKIKNHWMTEFSASMDILKLRKRDREMGIV